MAEIAFARGIESARTDAQGKDSIAWFDRAARLNKYNDTYYRTLGDWLLVRLGGELSGVSEADTLTQESSKYVQSLIGAIVNAHARAIELSPYNVLNWLSRGVAYRELMSVLGDATEFAIQSHERAVELDPMNPSVATELGKTYFAASQIVRPLTASADKTVADDANEKMKQYLGKAEQIFGKAISLKSNYAPAHFELALVYDAQERTQDAIGKMESVAAYNTTDVGVMFQLGVMYLRRDAEGDVGRAQNALERAVDLSPKYSNARWYLASIYERQGDIAAAVREVEQVLKLNPDNGIVEARLERLSRGKIVTELPGEIE
jgi:tetratricopeptide (TPR) repeat protein